MSLDHSSESRLLTARSRADGAEPIAVAAGEHRGHVPAVAAPEHADAVGIAEPVAGECGIEDGEDVVDVDRAPTGAGDRVVLGTHDRLTPRRVPAAAATGVGHHDDEPGGGLDLRLIEEQLAVLRERSAVDVEQHGVLATRLEALRTHDPGVDLAGAVGRRHGELLPPEEAARDLGHGTVERDDLGWVLDRGLGHRDVPGPGVEGVHASADRRVSGSGRRRSVDDELEQVRVAAVLGGGQDACRRRATPASGTRHSG